VLPHATHQNTVGSANPRRLEPLTATSIASWPRLRTVCYVRSRMRSRGFTVMEMVLAGAIVLISLPPLVGALTTVWRMERSQTSDSHATNVAHVVLETMHHQMYNGWRAQPADPASRTDTRGHRLNDGEQKKRELLARKTYLDFFTAMKQDPKPVLSSRFCDAPAFAPLARELGTMTLGVDVTPVAGTSGVDMATVALTLRWSETDGRNASREFGTRLTRYLHDPAVVAP
jgi:hypothetical protein